MAREHVGTRENCADDIFHSTQSIQNYSDLHLYLLWIIIPAACCFAPPLKARSLRPTHSTMPLGVAKQRRTACRNNEEIIIPLLARQSCHLPGNTWRQDWIQYFQNRHILFGICLHHPLHPLEAWERVVALLGSVAFGLAATTYAHIWDYNDHDNMETAVVTVLGGQYAITKGMLVLWTLGGIFHSTFDIAMWNIMACACCHPGGRYGASAWAPVCRNCGSYMLIPVVLAVMGFCALLVLARVSLESNNDSYNNNNNNNDDDGSGQNQGDWQDIPDYDVDSVQGIRSFSFLSEYCVELMLTWFVYFFIMGTILFSGILGCHGRLPVLGGRPRDKRLVEEELMSPSNSSSTPAWGRAK